MPIVSQTHEISERDAAANPFDSPAAARRYASARPALHSRVLPSLLRTLAEQLPVADALDVGCGTGSSTHALLSHARTIVGLDASSEMLAQAARHPAITYAKGYAEALPFPGHSFDLVTVSSAYHWFDHDRFLGEASRVLREGGWLALYKIGTMGRLADGHAFDFWRREVFRARFPKVARNDEPVDDQRAAQFGFCEIAVETATHRQRFTLEGYVDNLLTHSSVIRVVAEHGETLASVRGWLKAELAPFFPAGSAEFLHEAHIHILRKHPAARG